MPSPNPQELARQLLSRWANDPAAYAREALNTEPWARQIDIINAVRDHPSVAVRSGHKVGKSRCAAILAHWWVSTRPDAWVVMTSSSGRQVKEILWAEFRKLYTRAPYVLGPLPADDPNTGYKLDDGRRVQGFSTDTPERMAGISGENVLFIVDEASGVPEPIFEAIEGNRAGGGRCVMFSNPTQTSGTFYDAFHTKKEFWHGIRLSSEDSPNVLAGRIVISGLATSTWVELKKKEWGEDSPIFQVRVRGNFPAQADDAVIGLGLVEAAASDRRREITLAVGQLHIGVDPARFGDDESVVVARRGRVILGLWTFQNLDGVQLAGKVREIIRDLRVPGEGVARVKIDSIGVGASCADQLRYAKDAQGRRLVELVEVIASEKALDESLYRTMRDQLWFAIRDWLKDGYLLPDDKLHGELVAPRFSYDARGRYQVESKDDLRKRLGRSPDRADALALAIFEGLSALREVEPTTPSYDDDHGYHFSSDERGYG